MPLPLFEPAAPDLALEAAALHAGLSATAAGVLARGATLYSAGHFFEAHEVWEEEWLRQQGETKALLQGLILCAAALHKGLGEGRANGCVRLFMSALQRLGPLAADQCGVDVAAVRAGCERALVVAHAWNGETGRAIERGDAPPLRAV
jgi:hypothetical protein